jgi:hypothetical protein
MFAPHDIHLAVEAQVMNQNGVALYFSSPIEEECWAKHVLAREDGTVKYLPVSNVCLECQALPDIKKIKCTHRIEGFGGNLKKSKKNRKRKMESTGEFKSTLTELYGNFKIKPEPFYDRGHIERCFKDDRKWVVDPQARIPLHFLFMDPNAGGRDQTALTGLFYLNGQFVITMLHTAPTKSYTKFIDFVFVCLEMYDAKIRRGNVMEPIVLAVESVNTWNGDAFARELNTRVMMGQMNLQNIHLLADESKQHDTTGQMIQRYGTTLSEARKTDMTIEMSRALEYGCIWHHPDLCTPSDWELSNVILVLVDQMSHWVHIDRNNSTFPKRFKTGGKNEGDPDDLALSFHSALWWIREVMNNPFYRAQYRIWTRYTK